MEYTARQGDCIYSIAHRTGHRWETIWNDPANADLRSLRRDPGVLLPGDRVTLPSRPRHEDAATEQQHPFRIRRETVRIRLVIRDDDGPRADVPFELRAGPVVRTGRTDGAGKIDEAVPADATHGTLKVGDHEVPVEFGALDPDDTVSGVQARLYHLGFDPGPATGEIDARTKWAIRQFQRAQSLPETGEADAATTDRLRREHGV